MRVSECGRSDEHLSHEYSFYYHDDIVTDECKGWGAWRLI